MLKVPCSVAKHRASGVVIDYPRRPSDRAGIFNERRLNHDHREH